jgi:GWxTD domain-containing protein
MSMRRFLLILAGACLLGTAGFAADPRQDWDKPTKKWIRGPVQCLLTEAEEKQFKALKTDEEAAKFVKDFWARRDPTPGTPENEFADLFWKRVGEAEKLFPQTTESGAMSDRGQVYLLLGRWTRMPPTGKTTDWVYENIPNVTPPTFTIQFSSASGGNPLLLGRKGFEQIVAANEFLRGLGTKAAEIYAPKPKAPEAPVQIESAPVAEVKTEESRILDEQALSDTLPTAFPVTLRADMYQATKGDTFVLVTLGVPKKGAEGASLVAFARLIPYTADQTPITLAAADSFAPAEPENSDAGETMLVFQGGAGAHPGRYSILAGVRDPASGKIGLVRQPLEVGDLSSGTLKLSTVILSNRLKGPEAPPDAGEGKRTPYYLGSFRIVPALSPSFQLGSNLAWYYQIYNATPDPATSKPNLKVEYDFLLLQQGEYRPVTAPQVLNRSSQVEAFSFPLVKSTPTQKGWVPGEYKLVIKVSDEVARVAAAPVEIPFTVVP